MIRIKQAILHIFDPGSLEPILSNNLLAIDHYDIKQYIEKKLSRIKQSDKQKECQLTDESVVYSFLKKVPEDFIAQTQALSQQFYDLTAPNPDIPTADLLWIEYEEDDQLFLAMLKLNHTQQLTHFVDYAEDGIKNNLIMNQVILPSMSQTIEEGFIFNENSDNIQIIEKKHLLENEGEKVFYLSEKFLKVAPKPSMNETIRQMKKAVSQTAKKFNESEYQQLAVAKQAIFEEVTENDLLDNQKFADKVYGNNASQKAAYIEASSDNGINQDHPLPASAQLMPNRMQRQKLKLSNGIEMTVPMALFNDPEVIEIQNNPDGTLRMILKNIEEMKNIF